MTKLTTERLEKLQDDLLQFQDHYSDPADKENYNIFVDALHVIDEFKAAKEKLLAYEQAAKNPAEYKVVSRFGDISLRNQKCEAEMYRSMKGFSVTPLYAAPVLPKQPDVTLTNEGETYKIIKAAEKLVRCKGRYHSEQNYRALAALFGVTVPDLPPLPTDEAPAQPVIPEGLIKAINRLLDNDGSRGCFDALGQHRAKTELERLLAAAQQNEPQNIPENIPAQPVSNPYKLPVRYFSYGSECGFDWHNTEKEAIEAAEAVIDDYRGDACDGWSEETDSVCWGVILQQATKVDERPRTDDDKCDPAIDTVCDYALLPELVGNSPVIPDD